MTPEDFRNLCSTLGVEPEHSMDPEELPDDAERIPMRAETENGDVINYHIGIDSDDWIVSFDLSGYTLDSNEFYHEDINVDGNELVISDVSGTRPSSGFGNAGFTNGEIHISNNGSSLYEKH